MALEDIFRALEEQADAEVSEILRIAQLQADAIAHEAKEEADRLIAARVGAAEEIVKARADKTVNAAKLNARRGLAAVRDTAVDRVFLEAAEKLKKLRSDKSYPAIFKALAAEALDGVGEACELRVAPADADLAARTVKELGANCTVAATLDTSGGVDVAYDDGRVVRRNTFESRLAKVRNMAQAQVAEVLVS